MKTLYIARHGKAETRLEGKNDHGRVLIETGIERTRKVALWLRKMGIAPALILCSDAARCLETAAIIRSVLELPETLQQIEPMLYLADKERLVSICRKQDDKFESILLVAHDPGLIDLFNHAASSQLDKMPTSAISGLSFPVKHWKDIDLTACEVTFLHTPKH